MNYLLDIILDCFNDTRRVEFEDSVNVFEYFYNNPQNCCISSSSLDNISFLKTDELKRKKGYKTKKARTISNLLIEDLVSKFKIAKTPSYIEIDYDDIEDSQVIASAKAIDAKVIARDKGLLQKYPNIAISPSNYLKTKNQKIT